MRTNTGYFKVFSKTIWLLALLLVVATTGCDRDHGGSTAAPAALDTVRPTVSVTSPTSLATDVPINRKITIGFSEEMNAATITTSSITMKETVSGVNVPGVVAATGTSATFDPSSDLANNTNYTVTITTAAKDTSGNALASNFVFTFTTGAAADLTAPTVSVTSPTAAALDVPFNRIVTIGFSEAMDPLTITATSITMKETVSGANVAGAVAAFNTSATFDPTSNLTADTNYTVTITTGVRDLADNAMAADYSFTFTTGSVADTTAPTVSLTSPADTESDVPVNRIVSIGFSEAMDPLTITTVSMTMKETVSGTNVPGTVTPVNTSATFDPLTNLANSTNYTVTVSTGVTDLAGNAMAVNYVFTFTTGAAADTVRPTVSVTSPTDTAVAVPINRVVTIGFSEAMDPLTISTASISMKATISGTNVPGSVIPLTTSATFDPTSDLAVNTNYTVTITTAARDLAGNGMLSNYVFTFTTGASADAVRPTVSFTNPADLAIEAPVNSTVEIGFSEAMDPLTLTTAFITMKETVSGNNVPGTVTPADTSALFAPTSYLTYGTEYTVTLTTAVKDLAGNGLLTNYVFTFTTGAAPSIIPGAICTTASGSTIPTVTMSDPTSDNQFVTTSTGTFGAGKLITATFDMAMDQTTINATTFTLQPMGGSVLSGSTVTYDADTKVASLTTTLDLLEDTRYTAIITQDVTSAAGEPIACSYAWDFKTTAPAAPGLTPIDLGLAAPFGIAATAGVTNTGATTINGDVALDPISGAICNSIQVDATGGFGLCGGSPPTINGMVISPLYPDAGITSSAIKADLLAAFLSITPPAGPPAAGSLSGATNIPAGTTLGDITGNPLVEGDNLFFPGVYQSITSIMITGDLTLDASGNPDAIFVFQSSSTIGTAAGAPSPGVHSRILLRNGAKASNVWWQVGTSATLGAYSEFQGNILASESITMVTGATSCGRLLAGAFTAGAFVFDSNVVSVPGNVNAPASCK